MTEEAGEQGAGCRGEKSGQRLILVPLTPKPPSPLPLLPCTLFPCQELPLLPLPAILFGTRFAPNIQI